MNTGIIRACLFRHCHASFRFAVLSMLVAAAAGCANLSTIDRKTEMPAYGQAIHLDVSQRVILTDKDGFACAEPSPDGLQSFASALGASVADPVAKAISLSTAYNASAASIGLRTQSITLMRETLYRLCEAARNKSLTSMDVAQLLQRSQDLTLAVLAIEQLTGAVVARQAMLTQGSNATASANVANTQAALDTAKKNEQIAKDALAAAQAEEQRQADNLKKIDDDLAAANKKDPPDQAAVDKLAAQQKEQSGKLQKAKDETKVANDVHVNAQKATQAILSNFNAALATAQAAATGSGSFSTAADRNNVDQHTVQHLSTAAQQIIDSVLTKGRLTDACITLMNQYASTTDAERRKDLMDLGLGLCKDVFRVYLEAYQLAVVGGLNPPAPLATDGGDVKTAGKSVDKPAGKTAGQKRVSPPAPAPQPSPRRPIAPSMPMIR